VFGAGADQHAGMDSALLTAEPPARGRLQYLVVRDSLAEEIARGTLKPGARLPSERSLQVTLGVYRGTVREALFQLEAEGLIYRKERSGWYVAPPRVTYDPSRPEGFTAWVAAQGRVPQTETLSKERVEASELVAPILGVRPGAPTFFVRRRRHIDGRACLVEHISLNPKLFPGLLERDLDVSLTGVMRRDYGRVVTRAEVSMYPCALTGAQAEDLRVKSGTPGLCLIRTCFDADGAVLEYDQEFWRHDIIRISLAVAMQA